MEQKKLIIVLSACIALIVTLLVVRSVVNGKNFFVRKAGEVKDNISYKFSDEYTSEKAINKYIAAFEKALQTEDYETMQTMMEDTFLDYKFAGSQEQFREYMKKFVAADAKLLLQEFEEQEDKYLCTLVLYKNKIATTFNIIITKDEDKPERIIMENLLSLNPYQKEAAIQGEKLHCSLVYTAIMNKEETCVLELENLKEEDLSLEYYDVKLFAQDGTIFKPSKETGEVTLTKSGKTRLSLNFVGSNLYQKQRLEIRLRDKEEQKHVETFTIYLGNVVF